MTESYQVEVYCNATTDECVFDECSRLESEVRWILGRSHGSHFRFLPRFAAVSYTFSKLGEAEAAFARVAREFEVEEFVPYPCGARLMRADGEGRTIRVLGLTPREAAEEEHPVQAKSSTLGPLLNGLESKIKDDPDEARNLVGDVRAMLQQCGAGCDRCSDRCCVLDLGRSMLHPDRWICPSCVHAELQVED